jgi:hypothetical protein
MGSMKGHLRGSYRRECTYLAPITDRDLAGAAEEAHTAEEMRERLKDEDELAIRALELDGLTRRQLLQRLTKFVAEMDRLANEDPTAGTLAEWAPATRAMFGKMTKSKIVGAVLEHDSLWSRRQRTGVGCSRNWPFGSPWIPTAVRCFEIAATWSSCRRPGGICS